MKQTTVKVSDNSGAKYAMCIGLYKNKTKAQIGDIILVSIRKLYKNLKAGNDISIGKKYKAIVIRTRKHLSNGYHNYYFLDNAVALIDNQSNPIGNRIFGSTLRLYCKRQLNHKKIINITEKAF
jgi:ribosomal protein L14